WRGRAISYASSPPAPGKNSGTSWTRRTRTSASIAISLRATSGSAVAPPTRRGPPPSRSLLRLRSRLRSVRHRALLHRHVRLRRRDRPRPRLRPEPRRSSPRLGSACSVASRSPSRARCASARTVARTRSTCPVASLSRRSSRHGASVYDAAARWCRRQGPVARGALLPALWREPEARDLWRVWRGARADMALLHSLRRRGGGAGGDRSRGSLISPTTALPARLLRAAPQRLTGFWPLSIFGL